MSGYKNLSLRLGNRDHTNAEPKSISVISQCYTAADGSAAVGESLPLAGAGNPGSDHVGVVAQLVDGSRQVVLDVFV